MGRRADLTCWRESPAPGSIWSQTLRTQGPAESPITGMGIGHDPSVPPDGSQYPQHFFRSVPGSLSGEYRWGAHGRDSLLGSIRTMFGPGIRNLRSAAGIFGSPFVNLGA